MLLLSIKYSTTVKGGKGYECEKFTGSEGESGGDGHFSHTLCRGRNAEREGGKRSSTKNTRAVGRSAPFFLFFIITEN